MAQPSDTKIESKRSHLNGSGGAAGGADGGVATPLVPSTTHSEVTNVTQGQSAPVVPPIPTVSQATASTPIIPGATWTSPWVQGQTGSLKTPIAGTVPSKTAHAPPWGLVGVPGSVYSEV